MKKHIILSVLVLSALAFSHQAQAQFFGLSIGSRGVAVGVGLPFCSPAPVYVARPVYVAPPPVVYATPPVAYAAPPVVVYAAPAPVVYPTYYGPAVVVGVGARYYGGHPYYSRGYYGHGYYGGGHGWHW